MSAIVSATAIGRATGLSLPTVCELLTAGWTFHADDHGQGWLSPEEDSR